MAVSPRLDGAFQSAASITVNAVPVNALLVGAAPAPRLWELDPRPQVRRGRPNEGVQRGTFEATNRGPASAEVLLPVKVVGSSTEAVIGSEFMLVAHVQWQQLGAR